MAQASTVCGHPGDQVIKRGNCVWLRSGFDDIWCLKHRQLAPELRQLMALKPCVARLSPKLCLRAWRQLPDTVAEWVADAPKKARAFIALELPEDQLDWAARDPNSAVRFIAAFRMPLDQLEWAANDPDGLVRFASTFHEHRR